MELLDAGDCLRCVMDFEKWFGLRTSPHLELQIVGGVLPGCTDSPYNNYSRRLIGMHMNLRAASHTNLHSRRQTGPSQKLKWQRTDLSTWTDVGSTRCFGVQWLLVEKFGTSSRYWASWKILILTSVQDIYFCMTPESIQPFSKTPEFWSLPIWILLFKVATIFVNLRHSLVSN